MTAPPVAPNVFDLQPATSAEYHYAAHAPATVLAAARREAHLAHAAEHRAAAAAKARTSVKAARAASAKTRDVSRGGGQDGTAEEEERQQRLLLVQRWQREEEEERALYHDCDLAFADPDNHNYGSDGIVNSRNGAAENGGEGGGDTAGDRGMAALPDADSYRRGLW